MMIAFRLTNVLYRIPFIQRVSFFLPVCPEHRSRSAYPGECRPSVRQIWGAWRSEKTQVLLLKSWKKTNRETRLPVRSSMWRGFVKRRDEIVSRRPAEIHSSHVFIPFSKLHVFVERCERNTDKKSVLPYECLSQIYFPVTRGIL